MSPTDAPATPPSPSAARSRCTSARREVVALKATESASYDVGDRHDMRSLTRNQAIEAPRRAEVVQGKGYSVSRHNATRHAILSSFVILPWESQEAYQAVFNALVAEHKPQGPTEDHLVEELAGVIWRKRRLRLAEAAAHRCGLQAARERIGGAKWAEMVETPAKPDESDLKLILGMALDIDRLEQLARYEVHLDRKFERMLAMLVRLKELRHAPEPD